MKLYPQQSASNNFSETELFAFLQKIKEYAERKTTLFVFLCTILLTISSYILKTLFYIYKKGYNSCFNIPDSYISMSGAFPYNIILYFILTVIILLFNVVSFYYYKNQKIGRYLIIFCAIIFLLLTSIFFIVDWSSFKSNLAFYILNALGMSVMLTFSFHGITISYWFSPQLSNLFIRKKPSKAILSKQSFPQAEQHANGVLNKEIDWFLISVGCLILLISMALLGAGTGFVSALTTKEIRIIPKQASNIKMLDSVVATNYAVISEKDNTYLICPCIEGENEVEIITNLQREINKTDVWVVKRRFLIINVKNIEI